MSTELYDSGEVDSSEESDFESFAYDINAGFKTRHLKFYQTSYKLFCFCSNQLTVKIEIKKSRKIRETVVCYLF